MLEQCPWIPQGTIQLVMCMHLVPNLWGLPAESLTIGFCKTHPACLRGALPMPHANSKTQTFIILTWTHSLKIHPHMDHSPKIHPLIDAFTKIYTAPSIQRRESCFQTVIIREISQVRLQLTYSKRENGNLSNLEEIESDKMQTLEGRRSGRKHGSSRWTQHNTWR